MHRIDLIPPPLALRLGLGVHDAVVNLSKGRQLPIAKHNHYSY